MESMGLASREQRIYKRETQALGCYLKAHEADKSDAIAMSNASETALRLKKSELLNLWGQCHS